MTPRDLVADYLAAAKRGDWEDASGYFADDSLIHIPGRSGSPVITVARMPPWAASRPCAYREGRIELELIDMLAGGRPIAIRRADQNLVDEALHKNVAP